MLKRADNSNIIFHEGDVMVIDDELESYLERLAGVLGHADRQTKKDLGRLANNIGCISVSIEDHSV